MLEKFGFTPTESKVYQELLKLGPSTGYVIARELGIARANVYQALESLYRRSAARKTATNPIKYIAAGPAALLHELERDFRRDLTELEQELHSLPLAPGATAQLEQLQSTDQLLSRATHCVDQARTELTAVVGPWAAPMFSRFAAARTRRVQLRIVSLGEPAPEGAGVRQVSEPELVEYWGGLPVVVVADRERAAAGIITGAGASGIMTTMPGVIPFLRHLVRREL